MVLHLEAATPKHLPHEDTEDVLGSQAAEYILLHICVEVKLIRKMSF